MQQTGIAYSFLAVQVQSQVGQSAGLAPLRRLVLPEIAHEAVFQTVGKPLGTIAWSSSAIERSGANGVTGRPTLAQLTGIRAANRIHGDGAESSGSAGLLDAWG